MQEPSRIITGPPWRLRLLKRVGIWLLYGGLFLGAFFFLCWWKGPMRYLRFHATEIQEYYKSTGSIRFDFVRLLRAKCSEEEFHRYAANQGLFPIPSKGPYDGTIRWARCPESWWTPPEDCGPEGGYYVEYKGRRCMLAYADGYLYYEMQNW